MPSAPTHAPTGTGPHHRPLTVAEAERGALPAPFTPAEWAALHAASVRIAAPIRCEVQDAAGRWVDVRPLVGYP